MAKRTKLTKLTKLGQLKPAPYNPRTISAEALAGLGRSISEFGDISGIVWNQRTGHLVCGHQRLDAIKQQYGDKLTLESTSNGAFLMAGKPTGGGIATAFPVRVVDWDEATEKAANVAANNHLLAGDFTDELGDIVKSIDKELAEALRLPELCDEYDFGPQAGEIEEDEVPEPPTKAITKPGDLWLLGEHRVLCGDSTLRGDVLRLMREDRAVLMNTDPPYGVSYANDERPNPGVAKPRVANDSLTDEALQGFLETVFRLAGCDALAESAAWYLWHAHLTQGFFAAAAAAAADILLHRQIIWVKPVLLLGRGQYHWKHEPCFMGWRKGFRPPDYGRGNGERDQTTIWEIASVASSDRKAFDHATPKPVGLFEIPLVKHTKVGGLCYDPFLGTGPQVIAAEQLGRKCYGLEIEPKYCDVIVERWQNLTGKKATREKGKA